jgi:hypothetical protein
MAQAEQGPSGFTDRKNGEPLDCADWGEIFAYAGTLIKSDLDKTISSPQQYLPEHINAVRAASYLCEILARSCHVIDYRNNPERCPKDLRDWLSQQPLRTLVK